MNPIGEEKYFKIKKEIGKYESESRLAHTCSVFEECKRLADMYGLDENDRDKLCTAALLHDITKDISGAKQIELCKKYGLRSPENAKEPMPTIHQDTGAYFAREIFGEEIVDDVVFGAMSAHTTGKEDMSNIDKLLFVADYIEPTRKYNSCIAMREYLYKECGKINKNDKAALYRLLNKAVIDIIGYTVTFLTEKRRNIDCRMILAWNSLL
ncbi:MAG: bis(5'-nucleosyl)-tetraphosphatase (symmetrical) YqeK [Clostridia bacterium]|nr:bis(5'-nucleosyl)-tetraphosphatase (symmetrical) YqeK [Clostridia bacterium]